MKADYVPNLTNLQWLGELNYRRLMKLMRAYEDEQEWLFEIETAGQQRSQLLLVLEQQTQYTCQLRMEFGPVVSSDLPFDAKVTMTVRLYHDANLAEITDGHRHYKGSYPYPNDAMLHKDEKFRLNQQLADLLGMCLKHGHRQSPVLDYQLA